MSDVMDETGLAAALAQDTRGNRTHLRGHALVLDDADRVAEKALAWVAARLTGPEAVEAVAEALRDQLGYSGSELMPMLREHAAEVLAAVQGLLGEDA